MSRNCMFVFKANRLTSTSWQFVLSGSLAAMKSTFRIHRVCLTSMWSFMAQQVSNQLWWNLSIKNLCQWLKNCRDFLRRRGMDCPRHLAAAVPIQISQYWLLQPPLPPKRGRAKRQRLFGRDQSGEQDDNRHTTRARTVLSAYSLHAEV